MAKEEEKGPKEIRFRAGEEDEEDMEGSSGKLLKLKPEEGQRRPLIQEIKAEKEPENEVASIELPESLKT